MSELKVSPRFVARTLGAVIISGIILLPLASCDLAKNSLKADRSTDMEVQDYRDALAQRLPEEKPSVADDSSIPAFKSYMAKPSDKLKPMPLVSIAVNQTVPLKDVLYEMADQADYDIQLDPRITGSVIYTARNRPFDEAIESLAKVSGLRYKFEGDSVRVELDTPYQKIYKINYLNYVRKNNSSISNNVSVVTGDGADTGSKFAAEASSEADFWTELNTNLTQIIGATNAAALRTKKDPKISAVSETAAPVEPVLLSSNGEISGGAAGAPGGSAQQAPGAPKAVVQPPEAVLRVEPLPVDEDAADGTPEASSDADAARFSVNKTAGLISVYAPERAQKEVEEYLEVVRKSVTSQVLIEAKVLEVSLSDEFAAGIDWSVTGLFRDKLAFATDSVGGSLAPALSPVPDPALSFVSSYVNGDFSVGIEALQRFGTVHALASPRITVLNNQSAVLNVATNQVYFDIDITTTDATDTSPAKTEVNSEIKNVPEGVLINVQPSIDMDSKVISMAVRPTVTRITEYVNNPGISYVVATSPNISEEDASLLQAPVPVVNVQEFDSVIQMNNGQPIVMGGLIQDRTNSEQNAVPVLGEMPVVGGLFRNQSDRVQKTELVVFLKATIVEGGNNIHETDKDLYRAFSQDRRPFDL